MIETDVSCTLNRVNLTPRLAADRRPQVEQDTIGAGVFRKPSRYSWGDFCDCADAPLHDGQSYRRKTVRVNKHRFPGGDGL